MSVRSAIQTAINVALGFVRERAPESSTRLLMLILGSTASAIGLSAVAYAFVRNHQVHELELLRAQLVAAGKPIEPFQSDNGVMMVTALGGVCTLFLGGGAVAIALRTRKGGEPGDASVQGSLGSTTMAPAPGAPSV